MGYCDYLWNKTYVSVPGDITPCCVPAAPKLGSLAVEPFDEIWNSPQYRKMRLQMAIKEPVAFCRGCQHIQELTDPKRIRRALQGRPLPAPGTFEEPTSTPAFTWAEARNARGYEIEFSVDHFATVSFSSSWHGPLLQENRYQLPDWIWEQAPEGKDISWRAFALLTSENGDEGIRFEVGQGVMAPA